MSKPAIEIEKIIEVRNSLHPNDTYSKAVLDATITELGELRKDKDIQWSKGFKAGEKAVNQENRSGCCCTITDEDELLSMCMLHSEPIKALQAKLEKAKSHLKHIHTSHHDIYSMGCQCSTCETLKQIEEE